MTYGAPNGDELAAEELELLVVLLVLTVEVPGVVVSAVVEAREAVVLVVEVDVELGTTAILLDDEEDVGACSGVEDNEVDIVLEVEVVGVEVTLITSLVEVAGAGTELEPEVDGAGTA